MPTAGPASGPNSSPRTIEAEIIGLGWPVGRLLGSEAELMERYGVSRSIFREAVRLLESRLVVEMRRGRGGGLFVARPDPGVVSDAVHHLDALGLGLRDVGIPVLRAGVGNGADQVVPAAPVTSTTRPISPRRCSASTPTRCSPSWDGRPMTSRNCASRASSEQRSYQRASLVD